MQLPAQPIRPLLALGPSWLDSHFLIETFGLIGVLAIVFIESGLLVGFMLPGDSLLFTAGLLSANDVLPPLWVLLVSIPVAAILGDQLGYVIGRKAGPAVFRRPDSRFFKQEYVERSQQYFEHYGGRTIVIARFVPIVRTIAPVMAGVSKMDYRRFLFFNVIGGIAWGVGLTSLGYFLGQIEFIEENLEPIILLIVAISFIPIVLELRRARRDPPPPEPPPA
ncbi:MAG: DedA family protein [Actinobacteria bacterium]|nr:DedA family protein [Actinomycetota bacterium]